VGFGIGIVTGKTTIVEFLLGGGIGMFFVWVGLMMIQVRAYKLVNQIPDKVRNPYSGVLDISMPSTFAAWSWPFKRQVDEAYIPAYQSIRGKAILFRLVWVGLGIVAAFGNFFLLPFGLPLFSIAALIMLQRFLPVWWKSPPIPGHTTS
jgi:hypothetical protein